LLPSPFHSTTTIEEGNDIATVTFFTTKPLKKVTTIVVAFFYNKAIKKGDKSYRHLLLFKDKEEGDNNIYCHLCRCNTTTEEDDNALSSSFSSQTQRRR
jgi:hypothetical protein